MTWSFQMYYRSKPGKVFKFKTKEEAMQAFASQVSACKFGLVGHSVSYPKQEQLDAVHAAPVPRPQAQRAQPDTM